MIVLSGGTGTPKLIRGLRRILPDEKLTVIVNTAEDLWVSGNLVSPDLDTVLYLFSGRLDESKWWGVRNDTFTTHEFLARMGMSERLRIGDIDRSTHILRSDLIRNGASLTRASRHLASVMGIRTRILPMCDEKVDTMITTPGGEMHFQDFWIGEHGKPDVLDVRFEGIAQARPTREVIAALKSEANVLIGPSNPITSIGPILKLAGMKEILKGKTVIAVSPIIGNAPVSGPAGKFMKACRLPVSSEGVARCYGDILATLVIDQNDDDENGIPVNVARFDTVMTSLEKSEALARSILELFSDI